MRIKKYVQIKLLIPLSNKLACILRSFQIALVLNNSCKSHLLAHNEQIWIFRFKFRIMFRIQNYTDSMEKKQSNRK